MIYTDKKYLTADSKKELEDFIKSIELMSLVCIDQLGTDPVHVHVPLFDEWQIKSVLDNGAKLVTTAEMVELSEKCQ